MKMFGKKILVIAAALAILLGTAAIGQAEILPPHGQGQIGYEAVILCESLTLRQDRSTSSKAVKSLHYGDQIIVGEYGDGWAQCFTSDSEQDGAIGWVSMEYIVIDPAWYRTDEATPVYAWNNLNAPKVALVNKGKTLAILKDMGDWVIVSLRGATGWIHKTEKDLLYVNPAAEEANQEEATAAAEAKAEEAQEAEEAKAEEAQEAVEEETKAEEAQEAVEEEPEEEKTESTEAEEAKEEAEP